VGPLEFERPGSNQIKLAAQIKSFAPESYVEAKVLPFCDRYAQLAIVAADEALSQAGLAREERQGPTTAVILGTGVGGGVVVDGRVLDGPNGVAGEWGHNPLPWPRDDERPGARCFCGHHGCIETFLAGPGLVRDHAKMTGETLATHEIVARAAAGDAACEATLARYDERLARSLAHIVNVLDPDVIVLGGGLSNLGRLYTRVPALWGEWVFSDRVDTRLVRNVHGDSSGVRGAAWLR
jgi:fructokinase